MVFQLPPLRMDFLDALTDDTAFFNMQNFASLKGAKLADSFAKLYQDEKKEDWHWFDPHLTYDNARLSQAMFVAYIMTGDRKYLDIAQDSMNFLLKTQMVNGVFIPIGNDGSYKRGEERAIYDQQPLEATAIVETAIDAYFATINKLYLSVAYKVFRWFLGENSCGLGLYNPETGGCFDGLNHNKVNMNQGAESSISYLLARLRFAELRHGFMLKKVRWNNGKNF